MKWILVFLVLAVGAEIASTQDSSPMHPLPDAPSAWQAVPNYRPITPEERVHWFVKSTVGPGSLLLKGPFSAGITTAQNKPSEYGPHWEGFAKRYGMRLTGVATGSLMQATLGAIWGEDPRYFPSQTRGFGPRFKHVMLTTFLAPHRDGRYYPAYARYAGIVGNNFLSNTWRADSVATTNRALARCGWGILSRMESQAFQEFWPDVRKKIAHK
jgi:hypothetical protein